MQVGKEDSQHVWGSVVDAKWATCKPIEQREGVFCCLLIVKIKPMYKCSSQSKPLANTDPEADPEAEPIPKPVPVPCSKPVSVPCSKPVPMPCVMPVPVACTNPIPVPHTEPVPVPCTEPEPRRHMLQSQSPRWRSSPSSQSWRQFQGEHCHVDHCLGSWLDTGRDIFVACRPRLLFSGPCLRDYFWLLTINNTLNYFICLPRKNVGVWESPNKTHKSMESIKQHWTHTNILQWGLMSTECGWRRHPLIKYSLFIFRVMVDLELITGTLSVRWEFNLNVTVVYYKGTHIGMLLGDGTPCGHEKNMWHFISADYLLYRCLTVFLLAVKH